MRSKCNWNYACCVGGFVAKAIPAACVSLALLVPANAQFWGSWDYPQRQQPRQQSNPFGGWFGQPEYRPQYRPREREAPPQYRKRQREAPSQAREREGDQPDYSRAPAPRRKQNAGVTTPVVVMGDAMADWLAYGLEEAFAEQPEIAVVRKHRTTSGLIRYEPGRETEWAQIAREIIAAEKPKFIVMMIGMNDRQEIRERTRAPAAPGRGAARGNAPAPAVPVAQPPQSDATRKAQQSADEQNPELQESGKPSNEAPEEPAHPPTAVGTFEFHTEKWEAAYIKRIDATIAVLKSGGVPVLWVGLPAQRSNRATKESAYLNELFRQRAEKAGIIYVDVWDSFVDDDGRYTAHGPDFEGQTRRLRSGDGVYFTRAGARKLAHYVEREIERHNNRAIPVALPVPEPRSRAPQPKGPAERPLAGPVVPLTTLSGETNELLGGSGPPQAVADPIASRVLTKGESLPAPRGRADDFTWPPSDVVTAEPTTTGTTPMASAPTSTAASHTTTGEGHGRSSARRAKEEGAAERPLPVRRRPRAADDAPARR